MALQKEDREQVHETAKKDPESCQRISSTGLFLLFFIIFPSLGGWRYVAIYLVPFKHLNIYQYCYISDWIKLNNAIIMDDSLWSLHFISLLSLGLKFDWHWHAMPKLSTAQFVWQPRKLKTRDVLLVSFIHQIGPWWNHPVSANPCV